MPATRKARRRALWGIIAAVFLVGTGVGSVLPILPLFLRERGAGADMHARPALMVTEHG